MSAQITADFNVESADAEISTYFQIINRIRVMAVNKQDGKEKYEGTLGYIKNTWGICVSPLMLVSKIGVPPIIVNVQPGRYAHFGIRRNLMKVVHLWENHDEILYDINIDGFPIFQRWNTQLANINQNN